MNLSSCPHCSSDRVHRSRRRGFTEHALSLLGLRIRRCHACSLRFAQFGATVILIPDARRFLLRLALVSLALLALALVLALLSFASSALVG